MTEISKVKKTGYRGKKTNAATGKAHVLKRSLADFPAPRRIDDGKHEIGDTVKLLCGVSEQGKPYQTGGYSGDFPKALPGEWGTFEGVETRIVGINGVAKLCKIKLMHVIAFLPDDGLHFEWS